MNTNRKCQVYTCPNSEFCALCDHLKDLELKLSVKIEHVFNKYEISSTKEDKNSIACGPILLRALCYIVQQEHQLISRKDIESVAWPDICVGVNSVPVLIFELRKVLSITSMELITIRSRGYVLKHRKHTNE